MTAAEAIARRSSLVRFDPNRPVADALLVQLLSLAARSPSPHHLQPWRFLVVRHQAQRDRLRRCAFLHPRLAEAPVVLILLGYQNPHRTHWPLILEQMQADVPLTAEEIGRMNTEVQRDLAAEPDLGSWACRQVQSAATTLMIAAQATVPIDRYEPGPIRDTFGIPLDHSVCGLIAMGYAQEETLTLSSLPLAELCFEEHFGQPWTLGEGNMLGEGMGESD